MPLADVCTRNVIVAHRSTTIQEVARLMRAQHVGAVLVVDECNGDQVPVGILTDRDIVVAVVAMKLDPATLAAEDVMSQQLMTAPEEQSVLETVQQMRSAGVRRIPVVNRRGALAGIVSIDDLIQLLAEEISELAKLTVHERRKETYARH